MEMGFAGGGETMELEHSEMNPTLYKLIEPFLATAYGGLGGAFWGRILGMVITWRNPRARTQYANACARECSPSLAAMFGIDSIMRGLRGKDDLTSKLVTGAGGGLALSFAMKRWKLKPPHALSYALSSAAGLALLSGTMFKMEETVESLDAQDAFYTETRVMLSKPGLEEYEKRFKKGHFTDLTLPLLTDRELQEMNIPPGARLLILDHIKRCHKKVNRK